MEPVDPLTGLAERPALAAELDRHLAERRPGEVLGVLLCDLDRLRVVNDALGHGAGDEVLVVAARRLAGAVRAGDSVGRFGGDQFVVVASGLPARRDLEVLARRLLEVLRQPTAPAGGASLVVPASIGIATVAGGDRGDAGELLRDADLALHAAKEAGGDRFAVADDGDRAAAVARLELEQELRAALRDDQLAVHYQAIVDAGTGVAERAEALVRWNHPQRGTVLPSEFLPVATETGLVVEVGRLVLEEACRQAAAWSARFGRPITATVNVAERQLLDTGLVDTVIGALAASGLPAGQLELEVGGEVIVDRLDRVEAILRRLDLLGVRLVVADVAIGRTSLARLERLPRISTLKIDRSFVSGVVDRSDAFDRRIVAAVVALAEGLEMSVVAEGVETEDQAAALRSLGVRQLQGFLFHRPGPASTLDEVLGAGRAISR